MPYTLKALDKHPGANPHNGARGQHGYFWGVYTHKVFGRTIGRFDCSRWRPHQSKRQAARYARMVAGA